jgi:hypothetical protein
MTPPEVPGIAETVRGWEDVTFTTEAAAEAERFVESIFEVKEAIKNCI